MAKTILNTVIAIDPDASTVTFYSMTGNEKSTITTESVSYRARPFDSEFFEKFTDILRKYAEKHPSDVAAKVTVVLPNRVIAQDTINVPTIKKLQMNSSVDVSMERIYKNKANLKINKFLAAQNKQYSTYSLTMIRSQLLAAIYTACSTSKMMASTVTFVSNAAVNAAQILSPKLKNASYLLLDIKEESAHFAFVAKGRTTGSYSLPFGASILRGGKKLASEDMLFDHSLGELTVLNAKERAKAKALTVMGDDSATQVGQAQANDAVDAVDNPDSFEDDTPSIVSTPTVESTNTIKVLPKKQPRKLPKFMLRPTPETEEGYTYENFRIFMKWALSLIQGNKKLTEQGKPETVVVNMDPEFAFLFDMINAEKEENGLEFQPLELHNEKPIVWQNLELYGGFFTNNFNKTNNF